MFIDKVTSASVLYISKILTIIVFFISNLKLAVTL